MDRPFPTFADRLRDWRSRLGLTQRQAAERLAVHPNTLARWERGDMAPGTPGPVLAAMAAVETQAQPPDDQADLLAAMADALRQAHERFGSWSAVATALGGRWAAHNLRRWALGLAVPSDSVAVYRVATTLAGRRGKKSQNSADSA